ncbi:MAG: hypothetical protein R6U98_07455 [Pirellulaceae bacterium]
MESRPTQAVLPLVGLATDKVIRDRYRWPYQSSPYGSLYHVTCSFCSFGSAGGVMGRFTSHG